jgi:heat shock protein HtpX
MSDSQTDSKTGSLLPVAGPAETPYLFVRGLPSAPHFDPELMKRITLFALTNIAVLVVISIVVRALGLDRWISAHGMSYTGLMVMSMVIGFSGSLFSLLISKWMAIRAYSIELIKTPSNSTEQWLVQTVREQSEKAGIPMPDVGVYDSPEANAFATGRSRKSALVAVSSGLLHQMRQREVEGVLAHEVAHIANGDMVTMTLLQGVLNTFVIFFSRVIGLLVDSFLQGNRRDEEGRSSGTGIGFFIGSLVAQIFLGLLASLVVMAYSRRREFAADAMAARIEGRDAMVGALQRLKMIHEGGGVLDDRSASLAAFKISHNYGNWFASHPPLDDHIRALQQTV